VPKGKETQTTTTKTTAPTTTAARFVIFRRFPCAGFHSELCIAVSVDSPDICGVETLGERAMRMGELEINDYARQLLDAHGSRAIVEAAQKAYGYEEKGQTEEAETWRRIEAALKFMRGPNAS
jgi:hypothetical protein